MATYSGDYDFFILHMILQLINDLVVVEHNDLVLVLNMPNNSLWDSNPGSVQAILKHEIFGLRLFLFNICGIFWMLSCWKITIFIPFPIFLNRNAITLSHNAINPTEWGKVMHRDTIKKSPLHFIVSYPVNGWDFQMGVSQYHTLSSAWKFLRFKVFDNIGLCQSYSMHRMI